MDFTHVACGWGGRQVLGALKVTAGAGANGSTTTWYLCEACSNRGTADQLAGGYFKWSRPENLFAPRSGDVTRPDAAFSADTLCSEGGDVQMDHSQMED